MSKKRGITANPALDGMIDVPPAAPKPQAAPAPADGGRVRLSVSVLPQLYGQQRYRAGLGPFGRDPVIVEATPQQAQALHADEWLEVWEV